jgi:transcriptional accessory protein Tex/SPT6
MANLLSATTVRSGTRTTNRYEYVVRSTIAGKMKGNLERNMYEIYYDNSTK